jgi:hypothetical protein
MCAARFRALPQNLRVKREVGTAKVVDFALVLDPPHHTQQQQPVAVGMCETPVPSAFCKRLWEGWETAPSFSSVSMDVPFPPPPLALMSLCADDALLARSPCLTNNLNWVR